MKKLEHLSFLPTQTLQNLETVAEYSFFHGNCNYLHKFNKNLFFLQQDTLGNIGYITQALTGMSYLRETYIDSDMTRQL